MKNNYVLLISVFVVAGSLGFFGGMKFTQSRQPSLARFGSGQLGQRNGQVLGQNRNNGGFRPVIGDIVSSDDKSISVKLADGSSKVVLFGKSISINKAAEGTVEDLKVGMKVSVFGTSNTDGSVTATNIQINPILRGGEAVSPTSAAK